MTMHPIFCLTIRLLVSSNPLPPHSHCALPGLPLVNSLRPFSSPREPLEREEASYPAFPQGSNRRGDPSVHLGAAPTPL